MDFHPSRKFIMHVPINGISQKVTLDKRIYIWSVLHLSDEALLLRLFPPTFPFATYSRDSKLNTLTTVYSSSDHPHSRSRPKAQYIIWALIPRGFFFFFFFHIRLLSFQRTHYKCSLSLSLSPFPRIVGGLWGADLNFRCLH